MNVPTVNLPPLVRFGLYVLTAVGTPVVAYLQTQGYIGVAEVTLWGAEVVGVSSMAAFNTTAKISDDD
jgi:hypothetical protein